MNKLITALLAFGVFPISLGAQPSIVVVDTPMPAPGWALMEHALLEANSRAIDIFAERYIDSRGYLLHTPRWGTLDGPDDAIETYFNWTLIHALGGDDSILEHYKHGLEGHLLQYNELRTEKTVLPKNGTYFKEVITSSDWFHTGAGMRAFFLWGLSEPTNPLLRSRMTRFAGMVDCGDHRCVLIEFFYDRSKGFRDGAPRHPGAVQDSLREAAAGADAVLRLFGVAPVAAAGHSFGELTALCAAGVLSMEDFHELARLRGRLMGDQDGGRGAMLAVRAGLEEIEKISAAESLDLVVANRNAPAQVVLSGTTAEIERAAGALRVRQIDARRLPVSAAFHSPLVSDAEGPLADALEAIDFGDGTLPIYANSTGMPYPADAKEAKALLAGQLARPVLFDDLIRRMHRDGVRTFVETGPHARLSGLVAAILDGEPHHAFALDATHGSRSGIRDLARVLAQIGSLGHTVDLQPWDASFRPAAAPATAGRAALNFQVGGANIRTRKREPMQRDQIKAVPPAPSQGAPRERTAPRETGTPVPPATPTAPMAASVAEALRITQENMAALQRLQQQTSQLHQQFLEGQNASQQHYHTLLQQQQRFLDMAMGLPVAPAASVAPVVFSPPPVPSLLAAELPVALPSAPPPHATPAPAPVAPEASMTPSPGPASAPAAASGVDVAKVLLDIVAEKTGYPAEVLELRMELDSDLGIDSIKRVEILSALQDKLPNAPKVGPEQLGTLRTLQSILDLIVGDADAPAPASDPTPPVAEGRTGKVVAEPSVEAPAQRPLQRYVLRSRAFNGAAEEDVARPAAGAPIWITDGDPELASEILALLKSEGYQPQIVSAKSLNGSANEPVAGLVILPPREGASDADLLGVLQIVQAAGNGLRAAGRAGGAFLVSASRLDGAFGTNGGEIADPLTGGFAGLTKSAAGEWPDVRCRALDLAPDLKDSDAARAIVAEMFRAGPLEVGLNASGRRVLELVRSELPAANGSLPLGEGEVVVLSGGARGVTAEVALALAKSCRPTLVLLGRSPEPEAEPEWLATLETEAEIKQAILAGGDAESPREAGEMYRRIRGEREIRTNIRRMRETGATVRYLPVDVRDASAVSEALSSIREEYGLVRVLVHGAGVLADQHILDKTAESFQLVYEPKVAGLGPRACRRRPRPRWS